MAGSVPSWYYSGMSINLPSDLLLEAPSERDLEAVVSLLNRYGSLVLGEALTTADVLGAEWSMPGLELQDDVRVLRDAGGTVVGYVECVNASEPHVTNHLFVAVDPDSFADRRGALESLLDWAESRAEERIADAPPQARVNRGVGFYDEDVLLREILEDRGYRRIRSILRMRGEYSEAPQVPPLPDGMRFRRFSELEDLFPVTEAIEDAFQDHFGHTTRSLEEAHRRFLHAFERDPMLDKTISFVLLQEKGAHEEEIAAVCLNRRESEELPEAGYVGTLGVRRQYRQRGLGLAALLRGIAEFVNMGKHTVLLHVDSDSLTGATRLYERAGMHRDRAVLIYEQELRPGEELRRLS